MKGQYTQTFLWLVRQHIAQIRDGWCGTDVATRCRDPEAQMFRNTAPQRDSKHPCHVTKAIQSRSVSRRGIPADSAFDWQGREQITPLHICLNLTPTKYKEFNASSLRGFLWEDFFQRLCKKKRSRLSPSTAEQFIFLNKIFIRKKKKKSKTLWLDVFYCLLFITKITLIIHKEFIQMSDQAVQAHLF